MVEMTGSIADFYQFHLQNLIKEPVIVSYYIVFHKIVGI